MLHKKRLATCSEGEFDRDMQAVDEVLRQREVPIGARELQAIPEICRKYGFSLGLHEPLAIRISGWLRARYGDRLKIDLSLGYYPVVIKVKGDVFRLRVPMLIAGGRIVCIAPPTPSIPNCPVINALDLVDRLPSDVAESLRTSELREIQTLFCEAEQNLRTIAPVMNAAGYKEGLSDLSTAVNTLTQDRPSIGESRWASLQSAEKFLKAWMNEKGVTFNWVHDLTQLADVAVANGLPAQ